MKTFQTKKRFGQNFLQDDVIIRRIIAAISPQKNDRILEVGPGVGAITLPLLRSVGCLDAVEIDRDIIPLLQKNATGVGELVIHQQDVLSFKLDSLTQEKSSLRVVGNLPYNISTPLLFYLFSQQCLIKDMHFMLQKEVGARLAAAPGSKKFGRLSVMAQYNCDIEMLFDVPPAAFDPAPKVHSTFVRLLPRALPFRVNDKDKFAKIVCLAFTQRRKTILNTLKTQVTRERLISLGIDPTLRPEDLTVEDYVNISNGMMEN